MSGAGSVPPPQGDLNNNDDGDDKMDTTDAPVVADASGSITAPVDAERGVDDVTAAIDDVHVAQGTAVSTDAQVVVQIPVIESSDAEHSRVEFATEEDLLGSVLLDSDARMDEDVSEEQENALLGDSSEPLPNLDPETLESILGAKSGKTKASSESGASGKNAPSGSDSEGSRKPGSRKDYRTTDGSERETPRNLSRDGDTDPWDFEAKKKQAEEQKKRELAAEVERKRLARNESLDSSAENEPVVIGKGGNSPRRT